jgi:ornithine cyclodeaminase/alanine dehydrogenase-like protein (mu-crystallin family)
MQHIDAIHNAIVLSNTEITNILTNIGWPTIIDAISETFIEEAHGRVVSPAKTVISFPETNNDFRLMPSYMKLYPDFCGVKIIGACTDNPRKYNLPLAIGMYVLNDKLTQRPLMMFDAGIPTAWRTAAATAVAVRNMTAPHAEILGIIGCGVQAHYHIPAIRAVRNLTKVMVCDLDEAKMTAVIDQHWGNIVRATKQEILEQADIVVTMTPTIKPHILTSDVQNRSMLICAVGGDSEKKMEFEPSILTVTDHFCDSLEQVAHTGTVHIGLRDGIIKPEDLKSLGDLMVGKQKYDLSKPLKMFLSTGVALEDLAMAILLYQVARLDDAGWY